MRSNRLHRLAQLSMLLFGASTAVTAITLPSVRAEFGLSYSEGGLLTLVRSLTLAVVVTASGLLAVRWGKKPLLTAGVFVLAVAVVAVYSVGSFPALLLAFVLFGTGLGAIEALVSPLVAELDPPRAAPNLNALHALFPVGLVAAALAGGEALAAKADWRLSFLALYPPALLLGIMFLRARFPKHTPEKRPAGGAGGLARDPVFWLLGMAMALSAGTEGCLTTWTANLIEDSFGASARTGAWGLAAFAAPMFAGRLLASSATRRIRLERLIVLASLAGVGGVLGLIVASGIDAGWVSFAASCGFLAVCGLAVAPFWPTMLALAEQRIPRSPTTLVFAVMATFGIAGYGLAPWIVGLLADRWGLRAGFAAMIPAFAAVIVLTAVADRRRRPTQGEV